HLAGNYVGQGGTVRLRTVLGDDGSASDRLVLEGGRASGTSAVQIVNRGGSGALTTGNGIPVVLARQGATTDADAFSLAGPVVQGPYQYDLLRGALDGSDAEGWYLRSRTSGTPLRPEASIYASVPSALQLAGLQSLANWHTRQGESDQGRWRGGAHLWVRGFGAQGDVRGRGLEHEGPDFDHEVRGVQVGADDLVHLSRDVNDRLGAYAGYETARAHVDHEGGAAGAFDAQSAQLGLYLTRLYADGRYIDSVLQGSRLWNVHSQSTQGLVAQTEGWSATGSIEVGQEIPVSRDGRWRVEPQAQLSGQRLHLDDFADEGGPVHLGDYDSLSARIGMRVVNHWGEDPARRLADGGVSEANSMWVRLNLQHEFGGDNAVGFETTQGPLQARSSLRGTTAQAELGASALLASDTSGQFSVGYERSLGGVRREGFAGSATANVGGLVGTGFGLTKRLSKSTSVAARLDYGRGASGGRDGVTGLVGLDSQW
ncbi:MAG TPA: autotransporter outer membrane beta-barrel domain-containing protein, partial [Burkholderiaceae bacterium]|nr:autotransporter outer membrane beta-barrel domain-containing protein [Burkholderiaceae bacterium]